MQLLGADWEGISRQLIGVPPQSLLDGSVKSGKIPLRTRGKLNRIEYEGGALKAQLRLYFFPGNEAARLLHDPPSLF
jgi:hypothetical protein